MRAVKSHHRTHLLLKLLLKAMRKEMKKMRMIEHHERKKEIKKVQGIR